ncbi:MAG: 2-amino-4-hydroxy-6-hydroxymethyldihydropteridine diphosphokinase [Candidatus Aegiribacteria sp.]|nr:2-amino-4-hydroxy-6-hydroxymethyldihydropteridine diphosphokinase [Candidatus Aegiribacteria sp.]
MAEFALGMGSNLENRIKCIIEGIRFLLSRSGMGLFRLSGVYETRPIEGVEGGDFLNCVFAGNFYGPVEELQKNCRETEILMGSRVMKKNSARTLDIDLLFFGDLIRDDKNLTLPHPGIQKRLFVLKPLCDVWHTIIPGLKSTPEELLDKCSDKSSVQSIYEIPQKGCFWEVPAED